MSKSGDYINGVRETGRKLDENASSVPSDTDTENEKLCGALSKSNIFTLLTHIEYFIRCKQ